MRRLLAILLVLCGPALAQFSSTAHHVYAGTALPAHCSAISGDVFVINNTNPTQLYLCTATDTWTAAGGGSTTATNLAGGTVGQIPYQTAASTTTFLAANTAATDQVLVSHGTGSAAQAPTLNSSISISGGINTGVGGATSGTSCWGGGTSGQTCISVAMVAGTPVTLIWPTGSPTTGYFLSDSGATTCPTFPSGVTPPATCHLLTWTAPSASSATGHVAMFRAGGCQNGTGSTGFDSAGAPPTVTCTTQGDGSIEPQLPFAVATAVQSQVVLPAGFSASNTNSWDLTFNSANTSGNAIWQLETMIKHPGTYAGSGSWVVVGQISTAIPGTAGLHTVMATTSLDTALAGAAAGDTIQLRLTLYSGSTASSLLETHLTFYY